MSRDLPEVDDVPEFPEGKAGVQSMLEYLLEADMPSRIALTEGLKPSLEDCQAVFVGKLGKEVYRYQKRLDRQARIVVRPLLKKQTDYLLWEASTEALRVYDGEARNFPGGYHEISDLMANDLMFYRFKFIEPGHKLGSAYDVLVFVNDHWCLIHRPWTVLIQ